MVTAMLTPTGAFPVIAARVWDVDPTAGTETLVARGLYRVSAGGTQTFQLHPGAWHFAAGHIPKLELLSQDAPYGRTPNGEFSVAITDLRLTCPCTTCREPRPPGGGDQARRYRGLLGAARRPDHPPPA